MPRRFALRTSVLLAVAAFGLSGCGNKDAQGGEGEVAESEALYVTVNGLKYQVQLSRQINPRDVEDRDYFRDVPANEAFLPRGQIFFGVFLRVENEGKKAVPSAREFTVEDTQGNEFEPVGAQNTFAYRPENIPGGGFLPDPERLQSYAGTRGALLLFKLPESSLDNRPLELAIKNPSDTRKAARVDLDV